MLIVSITQRDIARALNVSVTTVSNALRGQGRVSEELRTKILEMASRKGYFQTRLATTPMLGAIVCNTPQDPTQGSGDGTSSIQSASYFSVQAIEGIQSVIKEQGYSLVYHVMQGLDDGGVLPDMITHGLVQGVFLIGGSISDQYIAKVANTGLPVVLLFTEVDIVDLNTILANNRQGAYKAVKHLLELGHRRIGFINGWQSTHTSEMKMMGYEKALHEYNLPVEEELCLSADFTRRGGRQAMEQLLTLVPRPTAVFVADDIMAIGAMEACHERQLNIPTDIAIVGFGDSPLAVGAMPALTTVHVSKHKIGELAAKRMLQLLEDPNQEIQHLTVSCRVICRQSCGCQQTRSQGNNHAS